jgi:16S rRNA (cytidine1402-2'-O)-methyltransferase
MKKSARLYMIPSVLDEEAIQTIPGYILEIIKQCQVLFVENERTARRYLKALDKSIVIDRFEWVVIHNTEEHAVNILRKNISEGKIIGIISEAGCPGIADPGQLLASKAQEMQVPVIPLVGPSSILLALMASGMNGQQFRFVGYLPIDQPGRQQKIRELEADSLKTNCTQIFIETPYRNNQLVETILKTCKPTTRLCVAVNITGRKERIETKHISDWKKNPPDIQKEPAMFLLQA